MYTLYIIRNIILLYDKVYTAIINGQLRPKGMLTAKTDKVTTGNTDNNLNKYMHNYHLSIL